jgi:glycosyltransferase involved in cell wall biosynthesis
LSEPLVSILIPIRNEAAYIEGCLAAVLGQDYPAEKLEILIADGMSDDGTREIVEDFSRRDARISLVDNPGMIVPKGLNLLIPKSQGAILIRVDGHCVIAPDYVRNCVRHIQEDGVDGVGGPMRSIGEDHVSKVIALAMSSKFGVGGSSFRTENGETKLVDTVPFPAYTRQIIEKVGLYDEELVRDQDDEYNYRIRKAGGKLLLAADVCSTYYSRGSLQKLWRQYYQYGFYKVRVLQKYPRQMSPRQFVPLAFVLAILSLVLCAVLFSWGWLALVIFLGSYLLTSLVVSIILAAREGMGYFWLLPAAFATLHISYGLGFLAGLVKFWKNWGKCA